MGEKIGDINGKWSVLFKVLLAINGLLLPWIVGWGTWMTMAVIRIDYEAKLKTMDRLTGAMFIDIQDSLRAKNPDVNWLEAKDVREIQTRNAPYR